MIDNQKQAQEHFDEKCKVYNSKKELVKGETAYKPGAYFVAADGQIFDDKSVAMDHARGKRFSNKKIFSVINAAEKSEAGMSKKAKAAAKKEADKLKADKEKAGKAAAEKEKAEKISADKAEAEAKEDAKSATQREKEAGEKSADEKGKESKK